MSEHLRAKLTRRTFLQTTATAGSGLAAASLLGAERAAAEGPDLKPESVVLFQGDSITDAGRDKKGGSPNDAAGLGRGYPFLLGGVLLADYPEKRLTVYNRGISGNKVPDLAARWQQDAIDLEPAILSILIGVNDIWHKLGGHYSGTVADYETGYRELLQRSLKELPGADRRLRAVRAPLRGRQRELVSGIRPAARRGQEAGRGAAA